MIHKPPLGFLSRPLGQVMRPVAHQDRPPLERVRAGMGRFDPVPGHMRQGRHDNLPGRSGSSPAQSRKVERHLCGRAPRRARRGQRGRRRNAQ